MQFSPVEIPGTPIRPPDKPGEKKCPKCKQIYRSAKILNQKGKKIEVCPHCRKPLK